MGVQKRVFDYVRKMGIKQTAICRKTGITIDRMSAMNRNKARMTADEYESICKALEKQPNDFMEV